MDYEYLDAALKEKKMSRRKLAEALGINANTLGAAFRRRSNLPVDVVLSICDVLHLDYFELMGIDEHDDRLRRDYTDMAIEHELTKLSSNDIEFKILLNVRMLNEIGQQKCLEYVIDLTGNPRYGKLEEK